jgi:hypothetical protein
LIIGILAFIAEILPIVFYLVFLKRNRGQGLWVIFLFCIISLLTEVVAGIVRQQIVFSIFFIVQFTLFSFYFFITLHEKKFKYLPVIGAVALYVIAAFNFTKKTFDSTSTSTESILIIIYCILSLYEQIKDPEITFVYNTKKFWIVVAIFIYFSATFFLYVYVGKLSDEQRSSYWLINNFFEILKNILFSISFIMKKPKATSFVTDGIET